LTTGLCLVYLAWAPLGPEPVKRFLESYDRHPAGAEHVLAVALKGFRNGQDRSPWERELAASTHESLQMSAGGLDLGSYREAVERVRAERYCFLNTSSEVLCEGWLGHLERHLLAPDVGLVGAGGSFESAYSSAPRPLRLLRRDFEPFPNRHLRTNGFMLERELVLDLDWVAPRSKRRAWALESGRRSISRQVWERGLDVRVVGCDGVAYPSERWRESSTFRSGAQRNLLIADNRTRQYDQADPATKLQLEEMAWGDARVATTARGSHVR
jgi:hypothetical protein